MTRWWGCGFYDELRCDDGRGNDIDLDEKRTSHNVPLSCGELCDLWCKDTDYALDLYITRFPLGS